MYFSNHLYFSFKYFLGAISRSSHSLFSFSKKMSSDNAAIGARLKIYSKAFGFYIKIRKLDYKVEFTILNII